MTRDDLIREIQQRYRQLGRSLNELERRQWAARETLSLGWGGISLVSKALRISPNTINRGVRELQSQQAELDSPRPSPIRKPGGGRKSKRGLPFLFSETPKTPLRELPEGEKSESAKRDPEKKSL